MILSLFFVKQKTAYEMRISDGSSDVCSSDLSVRRGSRAPRIASSGAPTTTPSAYALITWPTCGSSLPSPRAISGISPMIANSLVPLANPPLASANRNRLATPGGRRGAADDAGPATGEGAGATLAPGYRRVGHEGI